MSVTMHHQKLSGMDLNGDSTRSHPATRDQGLTLVHYSAQRKHILWDRLGA